MFNNAANRYGVKSTKPSLKLKRRAESADRQASAREEVVSDGSDTSAPPEEEFWIDDHFQQTLKTLVRKFVEAENELYALQERIKRLKDSKSEGKVPTCLVVHRINAKGRNRGNPKTRKPETGIRNRNRKPETGIRNPESTNQRKQVLQVRENHLA